MGSVSVHTGVCMKTSQGTRASVWREDAAVGRSSGGLESLLCTFPLAGSRTLRGQGTEFRGRLAEGLGRRSGATWRKALPGRAVLPCCCCWNKPHKQPAGVSTRTPAPSRTQQRHAPSERMEEICPRPLAPGPSHPHGQRQPVGPSPSSSLGP